MKISDKCKKPLTDDQTKQFYWLLYWTAGREYYRFYQEPETIVAWDKSFAASRPAIPTIENDTSLEEHIYDLIEATNDWLPGWNDPACSFNLREYACFCYHVASLPPDEQKALFAKMKLASGGKETSLPSKWECPAAIAADKAYDIQTPVTPAKQSAGSSVWWWVLGGAGLAAIGAVVWGGAKPVGGKAQANPRKRLLEGLRSHEPTPKFNLGDKVLIDGRWPGEVSFNAGYDEHLGQYRYKVLTPDGSRIHYNENSLSLVEASENPAKGTSGRGLHPEGAEIIDNMARAAWALNWADREEEKGRSLSQVDVFYAAPKTPACANKWALKVANEIAQRNYLGTLTPYAAMQELYRKAEEANQAAGRSTEPAERFGSDIALQVLGHGVSWFDDNAEFELNLPHDEFYMNNPTCGESPNPTGRQGVTRDTVAWRRKVVTAAKLKFGAGKATPFFEHGQWHVELKNGSIWVAQDTVPGIGGTRIDFEQASGWSD